MSDFGDLGRKREEEIRQDALRDHQRRLAAQQEIESRELCEMCGLPIPEKRRVAIPGVQTCIECQGDIERINAQYGGKK